MKNLTRLSTLILTLAATVMVSGQTPAPRQSRPTPPAPATNPQIPTFRGGTDIIPIDVYPRDAKGQFVPNLKPADFVVLEDGVEQKVLNFTSVRGGQFFSDFATAAPPTRTEGLVLPKTAPPKDTAGRVFFIFIDDMHFMPGQTPE